MPKTSATLALALAVTGIVATTQAHAGVIGWGAPAGGSFFDSSRWENGAVPGTRDDVIFNARGSYGVSLNKSHANSRLLVGHDQVSLNLNGHRYRLSAERSGALLMGLQARDAAGLNLSNGMVKSSKGRLAYAPRSYASLNVLPGTTWMNKGPLVIGQKGKADLTISGAKVSSEDGRIGTVNGGRGRVNLSGPAALWRVGGAMHVGGSGSKGNLSLTDGAKVKVRNRLHIEEEGKLVLDGGIISTRTFKSDGTFLFREGLLELRGQGLTIGDGRQFGEQLDLSTGKKMKLGGPAEINAGALLNLSGGTFATAQTLYNKGTIRMTQGSHLAASSVNVRDTLAGSGDIAGDVLFAETGNLLLEIGGRNPGVSYDRIVIDGDATLTNVTVTFKDGFVPSEGDHFELVVADDITYAPGFSISLPELSGGLFFDVRQEANCLHAFVVVPEPGAITALLASAGLLMARRRRR